MKKVTQKTNARTAQTHSEDADSESATLFDAVRAEVRRARALIKTEPTKADGALETVEDLVRSVETKLSNICGLLRSAETNLGPPALAFARVDHLASDALLGGDLSDLRTTFSHGVGDVLEHLFCIRGEIEHITNDVDDDAEADRSDSLGTIHASGEA